MNGTDYNQKVDALYEWGAALFRGKTSDTELLEASHAYYAGGAERGFSVAELIDFLGVSTPSILSTAGFSDSEEVRVMELIAEEAAE